MNEPERWTAWKRCLRGQCPGCGGPGLFAGPREEPDARRVWSFRLREECPFCGLPLQAESGVTLGTAALGYAVVAVLVVGPLLLVTLAGWMGVWQAVWTGLALSLAVPLLLYPYLLRVTMGAWFALHPDAFEREEEADESIGPHS